MGLQKRTYQKVRKLMRPGDVIAFGGKSHFSEVIKWATGSGVSHVGIILQSKLVIEDKIQDGYFNQIIESASLNGFSGVIISRLSDRLDTYEGEIWWLPLSETVRKKLNFAKFYNFLLHQDRKKYDLPQAAKSAIDVMENVPLIGKATLNEEDFSRFFCSELVAAGLEAGGVLPKINASEITPIELCKMAIYNDDYYQIKGRNKKIKGYNKLDPKVWEED